MMVATRSWSGLSVQGRRSGVVGTKADPDLAYCSAAGDTPREAVAEAEVAVEAWLEAARSSGREVPRPSARAIHA
jgi:hypothetical protein